MKVQHVYYLAVIAVLFTACKKEKDYRDKWVGKYIGQSISWRSYSLEGTTYDTINEYVVNVSTWGDSCLVITEVGVSSDGRKPKVSSDGYFKEHFIGGYSPPIFEGNLQGDSIFYYNYHRTSPAFSSGYEFKGKKQKKKL
ncbi:MAG: hypothetical protein FWC34_06135 [Bacteroidetes bacterium]|nr:hypothetical protein [Bacteroidota bacterium]MCL2302973.1 hypothetical protein [Lentimicrobiaceae bacterium]